MKSRRELLEMVEAIRREREHIASLGERRVDAISRLYAASDELLREYSAKPNHFNTFKELVPKVEKLASKARAAREKGDLEARDLASFEAVLAECKRGLKFKDSRILPRAQAALARLEEDGTAPLRLQDAIDAYALEYGKLTTRRAQLATQLHHAEQRLGLFRSHASADPRALEEFERRAGDYHARAAEALGATMSAVPARRAVRTLLHAAADPLLGFPTPPAEHDAARLLAFLDENDLGREPVARLIEYRGYSESKLKHFLADVAAFRAALDPCRAWLEAVAEQRKTRLLRVSLDVEPTLLAERAAASVRLLTRMGREANLDVAVPVDFLRWLQRGLRSGALEGARGAAQRTQRFSAEELERFESGGMQREVDELGKGIAEIDEVLEGLPRADEVG